MMKRSRGDSGARSILIAHPSADLYGSDRVMLESVTGLVDRGHRVVVTLPSAGALVREIEQRGASVEFCASPVLRKSALRPVGFVKLMVEAARSIPRSISVIRRNAAEVVYVNTLTVPLWILVGRVMRRPVVCHVHEAEASASLTVRRALCLPVLLANRLIVNSAFSLKVISGAIPRLARRAVVVYNAVSGPKTPILARDHLNGATKLLFVGRLSPRKGPDVAIAAVEDLRARGLTAELDLVGAEFPGYEWFTEELRDRVAAHGLTAQVHFHGFQDNVWPFLSRADIAIVPSTIDEPFGNTAVEAVLAARPLIVSATSGLVEAVEGYSSVSQVPPGRPEAIADAVEAVVGDWGRFRACALDDAASAASRHDAGHYGRQIADIVEELV
jgi:glycosyltransferase involved in cell wall biosynthesis